MHESHEKNGRKEKVMPVAEEDFRAFRISVGLFTWRRGRSRCTRET